MPFLLVHEWRGEAAFEQEGAVSGCLLVYNVTVLCYDRCKEW